MCEDYSLSRGLRAAPESTLLYHNILGVQPVLFYEMLYKFLQNHSSAFPLVKVALSIGGHRLDCHSNRCYIFMFIVPIMTDLADQPQLSSFVCTEPSGCNE